MVITFPRMGNICLAAKAFFEAVRIPYVVPEKINKKTLMIGAGVSPEDICLPFKIFMGSYNDCIKRGADTILITGSCGPCRFGEYCELQMKLLKSVKAYKQTVVIDAPFSVGKKEFLRRIGVISNASPLSGFCQLRALRQAIHILSLADKLDERAHWLSGYEIDKGKCKNLMINAHEEAENCRTPDDMQQALEHFDGQLRNVRTADNMQPIKVALIGEIYSMIEPFANLFIEEKLMDMGVSTSRMITPSWWLKDLAAKPLGLNSLSVNRAARSFLPYNTGGHARETIGHALLCQKQGFDGAIQIYPLGCMPEIVAKAILPSIQSKSNFPVLTLVIDEMTGEAGYETRIEAFIDMLQMRRKKGVMPA